MWPLRRRTASFHCGALFLCSVFWRNVRSLYARGQVVTLEHVLRAATGHVTITLLGAAVPLWYNNNAHARQLIIAIAWAIVTVSLMVTE
jgi:hypothetical protein